LTYDLEIQQGSRDCPDRCKISLNAAVRELSCKQRNGEKRSDDAKNSTAFALSGQ